jgi:2-succinyl-5-enolpyruvyl-6-hydroxy-3-cyclohexene-1-carboxylate synthase
VRDASTDRGAVNLRWADALIAGLASAGVEQAVISPGARSTPLVLACDRHPRIQTRTLLDERSAAFFALGLAQSKGTPVILIATSGSAPAHWYPAVIEASHARTPLILLSGDRPPEAHGWGANQTTDQTRLFGSQVRAFHDPGTPGDTPNATAFIHALGIRAATESRWPRPGPVHINLPFREPLIPEQWPAPPGTAEIHPITPPTLPQLPPPPEQLERIARSISGRPGLIVCGPGRFDDWFLRQVTRLARVIDAPLLADPLSGLRFGPHDRERVVTRYDAFLRSAGHPGGAPTEPAWVIRLGAPPVSRAVTDYLERSRAPLILCDPTGGWPDPDFFTTEMVRADPAGLCQALADLTPRPAPGQWAARFLELERRAAPDEVANSGSYPVEAQIIRQLLSCLPAGSLLFSGNSLPIRQLDSWSGSGETPLRIVANRGVSGIDGNVSTLLGLAASGNRVVGLLGDLALCHDMNGLLAAPGLDAVIVLLNNAGGGIFGYLPQARLDSFERYWLAPIGLDFEQLACLHNLDFHRTTGAAGFRPALEQALATPGVSLIEVVIDREQSMALHRQYWARFEGKDE